MTEIKVGMRVAVSPELWRDASPPRGLAKGESGTVTRIEANNEVLVRFDRPELGWSCGHWWFQRHHLVPAERRAPDNRKVPVTPGA